MITGKRVFLTAGIAILVASITYLFLFGKLFPYSPIIIGFDKNEHSNIRIYVQKGAKDIEYAAFDSILPLVEEFHDLKFLRKPQIYIFRDSLSYIHHSPSKARFCSFPNNRLFVSPWALKEAAEGKISLSIYFMHELSHILIFQHTGTVNGLRYPEWLLEGIAVYSSKQMGTGFYPSREEVYDAIIHDNFMPPSYYKTRKEKKVQLDTEHRVTFMYSEFGCIVDYMIDKFGKENFLRYMKRLINDNDHYKIFNEVFGIEFDKFLVDFQNHIAETCSLHQSTVSSSSQYSHALGILPSTCLY